MKAILISSLVAFCIGSGITYDYQSGKINKITEEYSTALASIRAKAEIAHKEKERVKTVYADALKVADKKYEEATNKLNTDLKRMRYERDSTRSSAMSRIASASRSSNELCFSKDRFESAVQRFDERVSGIVGEGSIRGTRLEITKEWAEQIRDIK